jgi:quercetin dioxygenase-like cupin family protein
MPRVTARRSETETVEGPPGVIRTTIAWNDSLMLCHFTLKKGAEIPMHSHPAAQNGYLIRGKLRMVWETGREFVAGPGDGWCFASNERHRAVILEDCEAVECFTPSRREYETAETGDRP